MFMGKSNKSVVRVFLYSMLFITVISTAILGFSWIDHERKNSAVGIETLRIEYWDSQKKLIKDETEKALDYIRYTRSRTDQLLKQLLKERVMEAHAIATAIYTRDHGKKSILAIKQLIKDALRPVRFSNGRGYFFIYSMTGQLELYPVKPQNEGSNHYNLKDKRGVYVVRNEIDVVKKMDEGFVINTTNQDPNSPETLYPKISFVKYFAPFDWYIGSKEYRIDFVQDIRNEILARIGKIRFGDDGYIFVFHYDGTALMHDLQKELIGQKLLDLQDINGVKVIREMRKAVEKKGGDFLAYSWNRPSTGKLSQKLSFVQGLDDWQWIIGAGVYLDEINQVIVGKKKTLDNRLTKQVISILILSFIIFTVALLLTVLFSRRLSKEFDVFMNYFQKSADFYQPIDKSKLFAAEFKILAESVNRMLEERQKIETSFRESEERLAVTFRSIGDGVITTDTEGNVLLINRAAEELTGWQQQEALGMTLNNIFILVDESSSEPLQNPLEQTLKTGQIVLLNGHAILEAKDGKRRLISDSAAPILDKNSEIIGAVMVFQDVTDKRKMEDERQKSQKLESLGLLAGGIAHDFNNLLTAILGNINLAKAYASPRDRIHKTLLLAEKATIQTKQLTQQLLTFAKGGTPIKKIHDIATLIREAVTFSSRGAKVKANFLLSDDLWAVEVDDGQMNQVLNNLIINAVQSMPEGGVVHVTAENIRADEMQNSNLIGTYKHYVKITISDNGCGIPEDKLSRIFDPYFTTKLKGSGLGLTSVYSIIKKHEGTIQVTSTVGKGTTFTLFIPGIAQKGSVVALEEKKQEMETLLKGSGRILVMDDDKMVGDVVMSQLDLLGFETDIALDGQEAIEMYKKKMAQNKPYDLVIMDLTIPGGLGGADTIEILLEIDPNINAIVSSGYSTDPVMANFCKFGFKGCIVKPYKLQELRKCLMDVMEN
jgi:PAS domain S-box-containing protein